MQVELSHFIYGPAPKKGYSIRAQSSSGVVSEFAEITMKYYVPINPDAIESIEHEARMFITTPTSPFLYFSRIFKRTKLDEKGRSGILNHTVLIPKDLLHKNLSYQIIDDALSKFETEHRIPLGDMPQLTIEWDENGSDEDIKNVEKYLHKDSLKKIVEGLTSNKESKMNPKIFIIYKNSSFKDRINLAYSLSKVLEIKLKISGLKIITEPPLPLLLDIFPDIVISKVMVKLKPNRGWVVVKPFPEDKGIHTAQDVNVEKVIDEIYGGEKL